MTGSDSALVAAFGMATSVPHAAALGFEAGPIADGKATMSMPWRADLVEDETSQALASGIITSMLDHCGGMALTAVRMGEFRPATLDLRMDFLRPAAAGAGVTVQVHCYRVAGPIAYVRGEAWDLDPADPIATVQGTFVHNGTPA
jgi:uncharacterized protein (TIGR00369 family)